MVSFIPKGGAIAAVLHQQQLHRLYQQQAAQAQAFYQGTQAGFYGSNSTATTSAAGLGSLWVNSIATSATTVVNCPTMPAAPIQVIERFDDRNLIQEGQGRYRFKPGSIYELTLPDGTMISMDGDGSYIISDKLGKVQYKAAPRDFNPFLNASDKIEGFIKFCGQHGVRKDEMMKLPLKLFIAWLVIEAAKADHEPEPDLALLPDLRKRTEARCSHCGRFMKRVIKAKIDLCRVECFEARIAA